MREPIIRDVLDLIDDYESPQRAAILFTCILVNIAETDWNKRSDAEGAVRAIADSLIKQWPAVRAATEH